LAASGTSHIGNRFDDFSVSVSFSSGWSVRVNTMFGASPELLSVALKLELSSSSLTDARSGPLTHALGNMISEARLKMMTG
jgi:hypothetical protein